jgi:cytochrome P450
LTFSCITHHLFGRYGTYAISKPQDRYLVDDLSGVKHRAMMYRWIYFRPLMEFLGSLKSISSVIFRSKAPHHARGARVRDYGWNSVQEFKKTEKGTEEGNSHTAGKLFSYEGTDLALRDTQIASECMDHLVAGVDTTGDTLCFTMWSLSRPEYADVQEKLCEELKTIDFPEDGVPSIQKLDSLPFLDAVIKEGLRLFAAIPMTLFREVPAEGKVMHGYSLPGGTIVGSQAYSLHRNEDIYPQSEEFRPERWLNMDKETELQMQRQFWAFSSGARSCIGQKYIPVQICLSLVWLWLR